MTAQADVETHERYQPLRLLGEGSRKRVHLVRDRWLDRQVAACSLRVPSPEDAALLRAEAALLARVGGAPQVVSVHDLLERDEGPVMVCQYLPGGTLRDLLQHGPLEVPRAVALAADVATALRATHAAGVVHRDVAPGNVWLDASGRAVLGDFGLAAAARAAAPRDVLVGTPRYAAPEQLRGGECDERSDLWSLGALLHELLTGRPVVRPGAPLEVVRATLARVPAAPSSLRPGLPGHLDRLVLQLLATDADERPASADEVLAALAQPAQRAPVERRAPRPRSSFVGRGYELGQLSRMLDDAACGMGGFALLRGEPGVGKTRTALELARRAQEDGWHVLTARCPQDPVVPAYWPWTQLLRTALRHLPQDQQPTEGERALLAGLLPELAGAGSGAERDPARLAVFDVVASLLRRLGDAQPVLLLLDDAHWIDPASALLGAHVTRELRTARVAVVACARTDDDGGAGGPEGLVAAATMSLHLPGLSLAETARYLETALDVTTDRLLLQELHERTDGNPFHIGELVRLLQSEAGLSAAGLVAVEQVAPTDVREVLSRRLGQVPAPCLELLQTLSVLGREAGIAALSRVSGLSPSQVLELLQQAVDHRVVVQVPGEPPRFRFTHALVRESLYERLPADRRTALHRRVVQALVETTVHDIGAPAAEIAHHARRAAADGDTLPAVVWSLRAGRRAALADAYEDAVLHLGHAVELGAELSLPDADGVVPPFGELLLELGEAQRALGQSEAARLTFLRAGGTAISTGDPDLLARAAVGYGLGLGGFGYVDRADGILISLLEEALAGLGQQDTPLRVRVLARLATELHFTPFRSRRLALSREAVDVAQRLEDPASELLATYSRTLALLGPDQLDEQRRTADRVVWLAEEQSDPDMAFRGHHLRLMVALETGAHEQARAEAAACRRIADEHRYAAHDWHAGVFRAMLVLAEGRHAEAVRLAQEALESGSRGSPEMAQVMHGAQLLVAHWGMGRLDELLDAVRVFADAYPHAPAWRATLAFCLTETGRNDEARVELESLAARGFSDLPEDGNFLAAAALLAHVAVRLRDVSRARALEEKLRPYAGRHVVIAAGAVSFVSVRMPLGVLRVTCGDVDAGISDLTAAHRLHQEAGTPALAVWCAEELARALLSRGLAADVAAARDVLEQALPEARSLGMPVHLARLEALLAQCDRRSAAPPAEANRVSILISDVAASTQLTEALGEGAVHALLGEHRRAVEAAATAEEGVVLKALGDAVLAALPTADAALRCATRLQQRFAAPGSPLRVRIGVHTGPVLREGDSLYGRTMILAFRIADVAGPGEVLVSADTRSAARTRTEFDEPRLLQLKGIAQPQEVCPLRWRPAPRPQD